MAEPDWNPDTGGRSLAEILREAGIESATRANRRRRWDDPEETGIRQRRAEAAAAGRPELGRRRSDRSVDDAPPVPERREVRRSVPESTAAIPGLRPDRKPGVPASTAFPSAPIRDIPLRDAPIRDDSPRDTPVRERRAPERRAPEPVPQRAAQRASGASHPQTGPIPVVRPGQTAEDLDADLESTPRESALAWLRFAGELIIALAVGVGVYFAATVLWEMVPHVAVLLAPLAVTGLVAGVGVWRQRQGREPIGLRLLAVLVFAGTLLTIVPAAGLLAGT
jgi:hypothetical protein